MIKVPYMVTEKHSDEQKIKANISSKRFYMAQALEKVFPKSETLTQNFLHEWYDSCEFNTKNINPKL